MSRMLLDERTADLLLIRVKALSAVSNGAWGRMNVTDMLYHCSAVNNSILQGKITNEQPTFKQRLLKMVILQLIRQLPKGIKTNPKFVRPTTDTTAFEAEQQRFSEMLIRFARHPDAIAGRHPLLGPLTTKEWRRFVWMHTDHHLRQFGV